MLERVGHEIVEGATHRAFVHHHRRQVAADVHVLLEPGVLDERRRRREDVAHDRAGVRGSRADESAGVAHAGVRQHLLDHVREPPAFLFDEIAVPPRLRRFVDDARREILRGRSNHGERRAKLVRDRGDEVHLLRGQPFRSPRVEDDETDRLTPAPRESRS